MVLLLYYDIRFFCFGDFLSDLEGGLLLNIQILNCKCASPSLRFLALLLSLEYTAYVLLATTEAKTSHKVKQRDLLTYTAKSSSS
jgi:hypothetical protein